MFKELYLYALYGVIMFSLNFLVSLYFVSDIIYFCCNFLTEGFVLHDTTGWVWAVWYTILFFSFWLSLPYIVLLVYFWTKSFLTQKEMIVIFLLSIIFFYNYCYTIYIYINDLFFSGFSFSTGLKVVFEFQPELESYLLLLFGLFYDFFITIIWFQIFLIFSYEMFIVNSFIYLVNIYIWSFLIYIYWFAGDGFLIDSWVCISIIVCIQIIIYFYLLLKQFRRYKFNS